MPTPSPRPGLVLLAAPAALVLLAAPGARADEAPFLYDRYALGHAPTLRVELESALGTRDTRPIGHDGFEQAARVQAGSGRFTLEARGGLLFTAAGLFASGGGVEGAYRLLDDADAPLRLTLGAGWAYDYQGVHVLRSRASVGKRLGAFDLVGNGLVEVPLSAERDTIDLVVGLGASYRLGEAARLGLELVGEDLEGFWEADEAEGGAKLLAGPTAGLRLSPTVDLKLNVGAVLTAAPSTTATPADTKAGVLARLVLAASF